MLKKIDFTQGSIIRNIAVFSAPIVMGELLQNLYNSVDALVVGNLIDKSALAAVTVSGVISSMVVNFFNGMSVGSNVVISKVFGKGDLEELRSKIRIVFSFAVCLGVIFSALGIAFTPQLLHLTGAQEEYIGDAQTYLRIYLAGVMFTVIYNNGAGVLRATGDSKTPFYILFLACTVNIVLDILFVGGLSLGVAGVALATVFSQALSVTLVYRAINRANQVRCVNFRELWYRGKETVLSVLRVGMAAGMQSALIGFSNIFVVRYMNLFNTATVAGIGVAQRLDKFILLPAKSFGITMTTFVSQNVGGCHYERVREGKKKCLLVALCVTLGLSTVIYIFADQCVALFNPDPQVTRVGVAMMRTLVPMYWMMGVREIYLGVLRGYGKNGIPMLLSLTGMVVCRQIYLAVTMRTPNPNLLHIYYCYPIAWAATLVLILGYYLLVRNQLTGLERRPGRRG